MVANSDSCSCPECEVLCRGKFPGCPAVWAAGPQTVNLRRPVSDVGRGLPGTGSTTNGNQASHPPLDAPVRPAAAPPVVGDGYGDLRPLLSALRTEVQVLTRKVDQMQPSQPMSEATERAVSAVEMLPDKVANVAMRAMRTQHEMNLRDLRELRQLIEKSAERAVPPSEGRDKPVTVTELNARFEWLVNELSDRLVILGNEVARIDKQLSAGGYDRPVGQ
jgi:hypothetical protein